MPFICTPMIEGGFIQFQKRSLFGKGSALPFQSWETSLSEKDLSAFRLLRDLIAEAEAFQKDDGILIPTESLLLLPDVHLQRLGVPPLAGLSVELSMRGRVDSSDSLLRIEWQDSGSRTINPDFKGPFLKVGREWHRLSFRLYELKEAALHFNQTTGKPFRERLPIWEKVQSVLSEHLGQQIRADNYLRAVRIYQAGALTLDIKETLDGPDFSPVLLPKGQDPELYAVDDGPDLENEGSFGQSEAAEPSQATTLLPPMLEETFEQQFSTQPSDTPPAYSLGNNCFVLIDPPMRRALDVVKRAKRWPEKERRDFLRNPRTVLAQVLGEDGDALAQTIFVETAQYSDRVHGLGLWEKPSLPWITKKSNQWLPERFPVTIGSKTVDTSAEEIDELEITYTNAKANGDDKVDFQGESFAIDEVGEALASLRGEDPERETDDPTTNAELQNQLPEKDNSVLLIQENLEANEYTAKFSQRTNRTPLAFPKVWINGTVPKRHQLDGFEWICNAWKQGWPGVLLADDMGVGKTFQALAFLAWIRANKANMKSIVRELTGPILIVAPTALLSNWKKEAEIHLVPNALGECCEVFGSHLKAIKRKSDGSIAPEDLLDIDQIRHADWILTTYDTLALYHKCFARVAFSVAIFDEIQKIKAPDTINSRTAKTANADFVLGMTGTPIENRIEDLWCIMDRIAPGYLKDLKTFSKIYGEESESALAELKEKMDKPQGKAPQVMLRRMKEQISKDLPTKTITPYEVLMPDRQASIYEQLIGDAKGKSVSHKSMLEILHKMRSVSLHPDSVEGIDLYDPAQRKNWILASARLAKTFDILTAIKKKGEKALIFLEDIAMQHALATAISEHFSLHQKPPVINGAMPGQKRQQYVDSFQALPKGFAVMILSPKAAGIGLTITAANHVIHLSRWWNPAVEDQCNDRTYRIGQKKDVTIHIPLAVHPAYKDGSFDVRLHELLERKRTLSQNMLAPPVREADAQALFGQVVN